MQVLQRGYCPGDGRAGKAFALKLGPEKMPSKAHSGALGTGTQWV